MIELATQYLLECWSVLREAAPFLLFGFLIAGLLKAFVPDASMSRHLGGRGLGSVLKAAAIGVPLPLCSCGVLPAAMGMRRQGAGPGATAAFMVATPESGVDSIAVTYAMIDPVMTVLRPLSAFVTAITAGLAANLLPERLLPGPVAQPPAAGCGCGGGGCCDAGAPASAGLLAKLRLGLNHAFGEMLSDVGVWLIVGILAAGAISLFLPPDFFLTYLGGEFTSMLAMMLVGVPMYVCASSSTPIAASLLLKGLSPGAALVFLLTGPATNATTIMAMGRAFGGALTVVYVGAIVTCSLALGLLTNRLYALLGLDVHAVVGHVGEALPGWLETGSAALLLALLAVSMLRRKSC